MKKCKHSTCANNTKHANGNIRYEDRCLINGTKKTIHFISDEVGEVWSCNKEKY